MELANRSTCALLSVKQNLDLDSTIVRRASRLMKSSQAPNETEENGEPAPVRRRQEGTGYSDDEVIPLPVVHQTGTGEKRLLRVKWEDYADSAHLWTTLGVYVFWPLHPFFSFSFPFFF